jgi:hypothetical protein
MQSKIKRRLFLAKEIHLFFRKNENNPLAREKHFVIHIHLPFGYIIQLPFHQFSFQRGNMIDEKFPFNMIILMKNDPGGEPGEG